MHIYIHLSPDREQFTVGYWLYSSFPFSSARERLYVITAFELPSRADVVTYKRETFAAAVVYALLCLFYIIYSRCFLSDGVVYCNEVLERRFYFDFSD